MEQNNIDPSNHMKARLATFARYEKILGKDTYPEVFRYKAAEFFIKLISVEMIFALIQTGRGLVDISLIAAYKIDIPGWVIGLDVIVMLIAWLTVVYKKGAATLIDALGDRIRGKDDNLPIGDVNSTQDINSVLGDKK